MGDLRRERRSAGGENDSDVGDPESRAGGGRELVVTRLVKSAGQSDRTRTSRHVLLVADCVQQLVTVLTLQT